MLIKRDCSEFHIGDHRQKKPEKKSDFRLLVLFLFAFDSIEDEGNSDDRCEDGFPR